MEAELLDQSGIWYYPNRGKYVTKIVLIKVKIGEKTYNITDTTLQLITILEGIINGS